jgi:hypothetical protein
LISSTENAANLPAPGLVIAGVVMPYHGS